MSDLTSSLDLIATAQSQKEVTANALHNAASPAMVFARRDSASLALTWAYYGGPVLTSTGVVRVSGGSIELDDDATNYVEFDESASPLPAIVSNTTGWTGGLQRCYLVTTAGGLVVNYEDWRAFGQITASAIESADPGDYYTGATVQAQLQEAGAALAALGGAVAADDVAIADAGAYYTGTDVEAALQEAGASIAALEAALAAVRYVVGGYYTGTPGADAIVLSHLVTEALTLPATLTGSIFRARVAATASAVATIRRTTSGGTATTLGTLTWAAAGTVPTVSFASDVALAAGDWLEIVAPATADATLADIACSIRAIKG
jgi:hypothetical protein